MGQIDRALKKVDPAPERRVWMIRLGRTSAAERAALDDGLITFDTGVRGDLSDSCSATI